MSGNNPYETPDVQSGPRGPLPWIFLSGILFSALLFMGYMLWRSMLLMQVARDREIQAREQAEVSQRQLAEAVKQVNSTA
ncbi:MAG: hypothetical protein P8J37_00025 [Fuerstiella sp.]|nr:hypothetical protein [Fuerstiella sp.]